MKTRLSEGYTKTIRATWMVKDLIYKETKHMSIKEYMAYLDENIGELKRKFRKKYKLRYCSTSRVCAAHEPHSKYNK